MDDTLELTIDGDDYLCTRGHGARVPEGYNAMTRAEYRQFVWRIAAADPRRLRSLAELAGVPIPWGGETPDVDVLAPALLEEIERGIAGFTVFVRQVTIMPPFVGDELSAIDLSDLLPPEAAREDTWHWVEIEVVDPDDAPVPNLRVRVTLPDGQLRELSTDAAGVLRIDHVRDAGDCTIAFPVLHGGTIEPI